MKAALPIVYLISKGVRRNFSQPLYRNLFYKYLSSVTSLRTNIINTEIKQNNEPDKRIEPLSSVKDISLASDTIYILKLLRGKIYNKATTYEELKSNKQFSILIKKFENSCHILLPNMLISGLRSLLEIGQPPDSQLINDIELVIMSRLKQFVMTDLISCLHLHNKYLFTKRQNTVVAMLIQNIYDRKSEIQETPQVLMLIQVFHLFDDEQWVSIQNIIINILPLLTSKDLIKIICTLAENTKRNTALLNPVGYYLRLKEKKPSLKETVNVLYALKVLNYLNPKLLLYLTNHRETDINDVEQQSVISGLLNVCGQLKWRHSGLLEACGLWILQHIDTCSSRELVSYILTIAALNYVPKNSLVLSSITNHSKLKEIDSKDIFLDVVWCLGMLNFLDKETLIKVLSPDFHSTLLDDSGFSVVSNKLKLLNLKSILKIQHPELVFSCNLFLDAPTLPRSVETEKCKNDVIESLNHIITKQKHMSSNINSDIGIIIDAEFILNSKGKPVPLSDFGLMSKPITSTSKALPQGAKRIALMIWLYKDYTLNEETLIGVNALAVRLLSSLGFTVVEIPYKTFVKQRTSVKKVKYLSEMIKDTVLKNISQK